tara:strand:- start:503 stop:631 length:129 start_codon:yes stop_codon:yes gene_type:complete
MLGNQHKKYEWPIAGIFDMVRFCIELTDFISPLSGELFHGKI